MKHISNQKLADAIHQRFPLTDPIRKAIAQTNRELFVSDGFRHLAYKLDALPMAANQWISSPLTVAKMTEYIGHEGADSILEIGCGSGYQAAVLSHLFRRVFAIERVEQLIHEARVRIRQAGISNINTRLGDGTEGWKEFAPFDRILFSASLDEFPKELFTQLKDGGIMVAPFEINGKQIIKRFVKQGMHYKEEKLDDCLFVPAVKGVLKL